MPTITPKGLTCHLVYAIFAAVLGMFQFGYNTGVINAPQSAIHDFITQMWLERYDEVIVSETLNLLSSIVVSIFAGGGMIGGFFGGFIANRCGRKRGLLLNNIIGIVGGALMGSTQVSESFEMLIIGRFLIGINCECEY
uniref:Major facilitator superfamily (MFS) profile domain-containing protein n=1 Tax=Strigamia maritima TaxID=126957 RepID=T1JHW6_STRMM